MAKAVTLKNQNDEEVYPVTSADLVNGEFSTSQIDDGAITTGKIADDAVTDDKIDWSTVGDSDWVNISNNNNWTVSCRKSGNIVCVRGDCGGGASISAGDYTTVGTLPVGYRPSATLYSIFTSKGSYISNTMRVQTDGVIALYASSASSYWGFTITFIV